MLNFYLGLVVGLSLIVDLGQQNVFVFEQAIKRNFIFWVCLICTVSDVALITVGIFLFYILQNQLTEQVVLFFNFLLVVFLIFYGFTRVRLVFNQKLINKVEEGIYQIKILINFYKFLKMMQKEIIDIMRIC